MTRILLVRPPFYSVFGMEKRIGNIPLGLCYIASVLEGEDHDVEILDCETLILGDKYDAGEMAYTHGLNVSYTKYAEVMGNANHPVWKKIARLITKKNADIIGFTATTATMSSVIHISKILRKESDTKIILGGIHPTVLSALSLEETGADIAVIGEGERTIVEIVNGKEFDNIMGIAYRKDSEICINKPRAFIENLDTIPFPARHLLDRTKYKDTAFGYLISSRGCPYNCCFCASKKMWGQRTRFRTAVNFVDEIEEVKLRYGTRLFRFTDDTFTLHKDRVLDFCREVKRRDLDISFRCGGRTDRVDKETLQALKSVGCSNISFGVESGSQRILDIIDKQTTVEKARKAIRISKEAGLKTLAFFIIGHPTETLQDIQATIKLIEEIEAHRTSVSIMTPYPGTQLFKPHLGYDWWKYYHQGKTVKSFSALSDDKLNEVYSIISQWVKNLNMGIKESRPICARS